MSTTNSLSKRLFDFMYFHRKRIGIASVVTAGYLALSERAIYAKSDLYRMGVAGSLATMVMETTHHFVDTVNIRSKVSKKPISSMGMASKIYSQEGIYGFSKGFSACYYGSIACGFIYFSLYKLFKSEIRAVLGDSSIATICFLSSFSAEMITLLVYFPYDMIKCRL